MIRIFRHVHPSYYAMLGATAISGGFGLYLTVFTGEELGPNWPISLVAGALLLAGGLLWSILALSLSEVQSVLDRAPVELDAEDREHVWRESFDSKPIMKLFFIGILFILAGAVAHPIHMVSKQASRNSLDSK